MKTKDNKKKRCKHEANSVILGDYICSKCYESILNPHPSGKGMSQELKSGSSVTDKPDGFRNGTSSKNEGEDKILWTGEEIAQYVNVTTDGMGGSNLFIDAEKARETFTFVKQSAIVVNKKEVVEMIEWIETELGLSEKQKGD